MDETFAPAYRNRPGKIRRFKRGHVQAYRLTLNKERALEAKVRMRQKLYQERTGRKVDEAMRGTSD